MSCAETYHHQELHLLSETVETGLPVKMTSRRSLLSLSLSLLTFQSSQFSLSPLTLSARSPLSLLSLISLA